MILPHVLFLGALVVWIAFLLFQSYGNQGDNGARGIVGSRGRRGEVGPPRYVTRLDGATGPVGPMGPSGLPGLPGAAKSNAYLGNITVTRSSEGPTAAYLGSPSPETYGIQLVLPLNNTITLGSPSVETLAYGQLPTAQITQVQNASGSTLNFVFGIPRGPQGLDGVQGPSGNPGSNGQQLPGLPGPLGDPGAAFTASGPSGLNALSNIQDFGGVPLDPYANNGTEFVYYAGSQIMIVTSPPEISSGFPNSRYNYINYWNPNGEAPSLVNYLNVGWGSTYHPNTFFLSLNSSTSPNGTNQFGTMTLNNILPNYSRFQGTLSEASGASVYSLGYTNVDGQLETFQFTTVSGPSPTSVQDQFNGSVQLTSLGSRYQ